MMPFWQRLKILMLSILAVMMKKRTKIMSRRKALTVKAGKKMSLITNRYNFLQKGEHLKTSYGEIKHFFGMHIAMGCIRFPRFRMYWQKKFKIAIIADTMSRDRFFKIREAFHVVVQNDVTEAEKKANVFWKVQPVIDSVGNACLKIPRQEHGRYSIDEQMIPFTGRCPVRQSLPNKPRGVGLKNEVLTTSEGLVLDFEIYQGKTTPLPEENIGLGPAFILRLVQTLPKGSKVFFDRYFTTLPLLHKLLQKGIYGTGTIMKNRIKGVKLTEDKRMKRGDMEEFCSPEDTVVVVQWKDLACCNAWMEYRKACREIGKPAKDTHDLLSFRLALAEVLVATQKTNNVEWSSENNEDETAQQPKRYRPADQPCPEKRLDGFNHWPEEMDLKSARMCRRKD